jgi:endonuclease YncB( thermonuclease family)
MGRRAGPYSLLKDLILEKRQVIMTSVLRILTITTALLCLPLLAGAATLQAKVVQVDSGNTLVVSNINRPLRIRLKAVMPPESGQAYSEAARDHLKALVLDKAVFVEYTHLAGGYLEAKVVLNGIDIGSQMLRDGVAWYDLASSYELSESDRALYVQCEQAARNEKRGLWQDPAAVAPWEFRQAQLAKLQAAVSSPLLQSSQRRTSSARSTGLSSNDLLGGMVAPGSIAGNPSSRQISPNSVPGEWVSYQPTSRRFSVRVPGNSYEYEYPVLDSDKKIVNINYVVGSDDGGSLYVMMWTRGTNDGHTDASVAADTIRGLLDGINKNLERMGQSLRATAGPGRDIKLGDFSGKQYRLSLDSLSAFVRVFSKQVADQREVFMVGAFAGPGAEPSVQFLNSLKLGANK